MKKGHEPIRMCVICRQRFAKKEIMRYVYQTVESQKNTLVADPTKVHNGRGYYVCSSQGCLEKFACMGSLRRNRKGVKYE